MASSPRARLKMSIHELARFFTALAATGNFALACDRIGRAKSGLYKRRARDPVFAADVEAALAQFRIALSAPAFAGEGDRPKGGGGANSALRTQPGALILCVAGTRPQLRRSPAGRLTAAGIAAFLRTLAATANIRFAAASVGVAASSIHRRRSVDRGFRRAMDQALDAAMARLELRLIEDADRTFDPHYEDEAWLDGAAQPERMSIDQALWFLNMRERRR
jgi:hypothetical protein